MKIEKLPSGSYRVRKMHKGKTYSLTFDYKPTQKEVIQAMAEKLDEIDIPSGKMTFEKAAMEYISSKGNILSPSTEREYLGTLKRLSDQFKDIPISELGQTDIQKEINRFAEFLAPKTVRNYHGFISAVLGQYKPQLRISTTLPQKFKNEPYIPSDEDVKQILNVARGSANEVALQLACYGMRRSEICALTLDDINGNIISINKAKVLDKNGNWIIKSTKTTSSTRELLIPDALADKIREQGYIYKGNPNSISDYLDNVQKKLGIPHFSIHKLRHYFASKLSAMNIPEADIMAMGGWETDYVMKNVYRHSMEAQKKKSQKLASDKLAKVILS